MERTQHDGVFRRGDSYWWVCDLGRRGGKRRRETGTARTLREAKAARDAVRGEVVAKTYVAPSKVTLRAYVDQTWLPALEASELRPNTVHYYRNRIAHVLAELGDYRLGELTPGDFDTLWRKLAADGMGKPSIQGTRTTAKKLMDYAKRKKVITTNPVEGSDVPQAEPAKRTEWWSKDELGTWLRSTESDRLHALWAVLGSTGCRRGEALALRWSDLDLDNAKVSITKARVLTYGVVREGEPKTDSGKRVIGIDARTVDALRRWRVTQEAPFGHVFTDTDGEPLHPTKVWRLFKASVSRAELRLIRLHDLRHSWASAAIEAGMGVKAVSERLGHSKVETTLDLYVHTGPEADQALADKMGELLWGTG
jgi:integrase